MNNWNLIILKQAEKYLKKLSSAEQKRIIQSLKLLIYDKSLVDIKPLKGRLEWRLRVVDFRILYREDQENKTYVVTKIKSRGSVLMFLYSTDSVSEMGVKTCKRSQLLDPTTGTFIYAMVRH